MREGLCEQLQNGKGIGHTQKMDQSWGLDTSATFHSCSWREEGEAAGASGGRGCDGNMAHDERRERLCMKKAKAVPLAFAQTDRRVSRTTCKRRAKRQLWVGQQNRRVSSGETRRMLRDGQVGVRRRVYYGMPAASSGSREAAEEQHQQAVGCAPTPPSHAHMPHATPRSRPFVSKATIPAAGDEQFDSLRGVADSGPCSNTAGRPQDKVPPTEAAEEAKE